MSNQSLAHLQNHRIIIATKGAILPDRHPCKFCGLKFRIRLARSEHERKCPSK